MNLECELARVQMKRYLGGEELPPELMSGLETHVKSCKSCKQHLDEQRLKLANQLAGTKAPPLWERLKEKLPKPEPKDPNVFAPPSPLHGALNPKTLVLSCCLAVVLFAMSAVAKNPSMVFGPKASTSLAPGKEVAAKAHGDEDSHGKSASSHDEEASSGHHDEEKPKDHSEEDSHGDKSHSDAGDSHGDAKKEEAHDKHGPAESEKDAPTEPAPSKPEEEKKEPEPKREEAKPEAKKPEAKKPEPSRTLLVADEGRKPRIKPAPRPRPRTTPTARRAKPPVRRAEPRRAAPPRAASSPRKNSIRVYDANGKPIR